MQDQIHLIRELMSQVSGEFLNMDGTFRIAGRTMDEAQCLFFILGEDAKVHGYAAVKSESKEELLPLLTRFVPRSSFLPTVRLCVRRTLPLSPFHLALFVHASFVPPPDDVGCRNRGRYAERRRRAGELHALKWLYDDLCCKGADDPSKNYMAEVLEVERAPFADSFHLTQVRCSRSFV